ncbi:unnamed protein product [Arabis nemorensis]|uniref:Uncharacterized protein n=1 Tax=Arabis nemorensis TaxID=586526 RepID=A0A565B3K2_9BRAS|nr:unnamed protein product [Arabis nemorensis]
MPKERPTLPVSSNRTRVSPYPLRSSRTNKPIIAPESPIQTENPKEWEDVRCVICMEPPHNAVLLHCSSSSNGCRPYMCDTSVRHSNCFKQYRKNNKNRVTKALNCPLCRGEVFETVKVKTARRFMNAKKRSCSVDNCEFSGTYSQLKIHMKAEHHGFVPPKVDPLRRRVWEQIQSDAEYAEVMSAAGIPQETGVVPPYNHPHPPVIQGVGEIMHNILGVNQARNGFDAANYPAGLMPGLSIRIMTVFHGWVRS